LIHAIPKRKQLALNNVTMMEQRWCKFYLSMLILLYALRSLVLCGVS
jgi:hypothetical protein